MSQHKSPFISRVQIKNFRNFLDVDVCLDHKQVLIGENNVGKTNFLRAIQLILDKDFSDNDRQLLPEDFHDSLESPMINGDEIEIILNIRGYEHNRKLVAQFSDAVIDANPQTLQFVYKWSPKKDENGNILTYKYEIYKGNNAANKFTNEDRNYINIYVIKALRDVERELKASKNSPLYKLLKQYNIPGENLEEISEALKEAAKGILELDEIIHIKNSLAKRFNTLSGLQYDNNITLRTFDIDTERLLYNLQVYMGKRERPISELSLGLANILYISLILLLLRDKTISPIISIQRFLELSQDAPDQILGRLYDQSENGNYILHDEYSKEDMERLYTFMDYHNYESLSFTILAVEEPEAHLHPVLQRLIYREILHNSETSVIFTTHSPNIAAVTPLESIVQIRRQKDSSKIFSSVSVDLGPRDKRDIERYIDVKRGDIYFGKGVILVEGITEEYLIPAFASIMDIPLDDHGIVLCNIDSTNFKPYIKLLDKLNIPWVLFTDGDLYIISKEDEKVFHTMASDGDDVAYRGNENIQDILLSLDKITLGEIPENINEQDTLFQNKGCYIGKYTIEVDMLEAAEEKGKDTFKTTYKELILGGDKMHKNFVAEIDKGDYWKALAKIEGNVSKGRFAQRLADNLSSDLMPQYIKAGIQKIVDQIQESYE